jgi:F0F1-type ATP synthase membrane subunit c/vacuolar-type H+-ATPase subunit K
MALGALGGSLTLLFIFSGRWVASFPRGVHAWLAGLPFRAASEAGLDRLVLTAGILVALTASANGLVRAVLAVAGSEIARSEERLRGGRFIGIVERVLIFGLAVAGEPAAAALIASAKSILRFPELSRVARSGAHAETATTEEDPGRIVADVDVVTEYFLLGSLVSWLVALAPVPLLFD